MNQVSDWRTTWAVGNIHRNSRLKKKREVTCDGPCSITNMVTHWCPSPFCSSLHHPSPRPPSPPSHPPFSVPMASPSSSSRNSSLPHSLILLPTPPPSPLTSPLPIHLLLPSLAQPPVPTLGPLEAMWPFCSWRHGVLRAQTPALNNGIDGVTPADWTMVPLLNRLL